MNSINVDGTVTASAFYVTQSDGSGYIVTASMSRSLWMTGSNQDIYREFGSSHFTTLEIESKNYSIKDNVGIRETLIENFLAPINKETIKKY